MLQAVTPFHFKRQARYISSLMLRMQVASGTIKVCVADKQDQQVKLWDNLKGWTGGLYFYCMQTNRDAGIAPIRDDGT